MPLAALSERTTWPPGQRVRDPRSGRFRVLEKTRAERHLGYWFRDYDSYFKMRSVEEWSQWLNEAIAYAQARRRRAQISFYARELRRQRDRRVFAAQVMSRLYRSGHIDLINNIRSFR